MSSVLAALDAVVEQYGRSAVADPVALAGALRAGNDPPSDAELEAMIRAAGAGVVNRMQEVMDRGGDAAAALAAAVTAVDPDADPGEPSPGRWASTLLGAVLGLLPRGWASDAGRPVVAQPGADDRPVDPAEETVGGPADPPAPARAASAAETVDIDPELSAPTGTPTAEAGLSSAGRRRWVVAEAAAVVVLVAAAVVLVSVTGSDRAAEAPAAMPLPVMPVPSGTTAAESAAATSPPQEPGLFDGASANPRDAFTDPALLAMAEPYISRPGVTCAADPTPQISMSEHVACDLGRGYLGFFQTMVTQDNVVAIRDGYIDAEGPQAVAGTVRSLRWKSVPGRPGVKTGIRAGSPDRGEGTRVRFLDHDGYKWLYFDVDGGLQYALLATPEPAYDLDDLRAFWADPGR